MFNESEKEAKEGQKVQDEISYEIASLWLPMQIDYSNFDLEGAIKRLAKVNYFLIRFFSTMSRLQQSGTLPLSGNLNGVIGGNFNNGFPCFFSY